MEWMQKEVKSRSAYLELRTDTISSLGRMRSLIFAVLANILMTIQPDVCLSTARIWNTFWVPPIKTRVNRHFSFTCAFLASVWSPSKSIDHFLRWRGWTRALCSRGSQCSSKWCFSVMLRLLSLQYKILPRRLTTTWAVAKGKNRCTHLLSSHVEKKQGPRKRSPQGRNFIFVQ